MSIGIKFSHRKAVGFWFADESVCSVWIYFCPDISLFAEDTEENRQYGISRGHERSYRKTLPFTYLPQLPVVPLTFATR